MNGIVLVPVLREIPECVGLDEGISGVARLVT